MALASPLLQHTTGRSILLIEYAVCTNMPQDGAKPILLHDAMFDCFFFDSTLFPWQPRQLHFRPPWTKMVMGKWDGKMQQLVIAMDAKIVPKMPMAVTVQLVNVISSHKVNATKPDYVMGRNSTWR